MRAELKPRSHSYLLLQILIQLILLLLLFFWQTWYLKSEPTK